MKYRKLKPENRQLNPSSSSCYNSAMNEEKTSHNLFVLVVIGFIFTLHSTLTVYITSSFLSQFIDESRVGIVYTLGSLLTIAFFTAIVGVLRRFGNYKTTLGLLFLTLLSLIGMAYSEYALLAFAFFMLNFVVIALTGFSFDIFLESFSSNAKTGKIRGTFLSVTNIAWILGPAVSAFLLNDDNFTKVFLVAGALLIPVLFLFKHNLKNFKDPEYTHVPFWKGFGEAWSDRNIRATLIIHLLLQFFYAWMVIYMPLYLHENIGFSWDVIGLILSGMLIPFVLVQAPLGRLADSRYGEKEIMSIGFVIIALATGALSFIEGSNPWVWFILLFITRIGAASVEVMADTYFFKKVDVSKVNIISFFRTTRPMAYVVSPVIATVLFSLIDIRALFFALGLLMLYALRYTMSIEDTL
jgi:MFS family permease